jgi:hypothetical protein
MLYLTLLSDVRSALTSAFRLADLVRIDFSHPFSLLVKEEDLIDYEMVDLLRSRVESTSTGSKVGLSDPDCVFLFLLLDILCKSYFTSFAQLLEREYRTSTHSTEEAFLNDRDRLLGTCSRLLEKFREIAAKRPGFDDLQHKLALLEETMTF